MPGNKGGLHVEKGQKVQLNCWEESQKIFLPFCLEGGAVCVCSERRLKAVRHCLMGSICFSLLGNMVKTRVANHVPSLSALKYINEDMIEKFLIPQMCLKRCAVPVTLEAGQHDTL